MSPCGQCLGIGNQVVVLKQFALFAKDGICHFAEPYQWELWVASLAAENSNVSLVMSMQASIASCMILVVRDQVLYRWVGLLLSLSCKI
jgi:hypothetical protein